MRLRAPLPLLALSAGLRPQRAAALGAPRYLASPGGLTLPLVLTQISSLIAGGVTGVLRK